jgi:hypothetical protein
VGVEVGLSPWERVFKNIVATKYNISSKGGEVTRGLEKIRNEKLHNLFCSGNITKIMN